MQTGLTVNDLAAKAVSEAQSRQDFISTSDHLEVRDAREFRVGDHGWFNIRDTAHSHIASRLGIPQPYYNRMKDNESSLLDQNVNTWLRAEPESKRLIRTFGNDGGVRALLSDRYRRLDNYDVLEATLPIFAEHELELRSSQITDRRMYLSFVSPRLEGDVKVGDTVQLGLTLSNSEIGEGALDLKLFLLRLICLNGMVRKSAFRGVHLGRRNSIDMEGANQFFSDRTKQMDDAALYAKLRDTVSGVLSNSNFQTMLTELREAAGTRVDGDVGKVTGSLCKKLDLSESEGSGVLRNLVEGGDLSVWGFANAVTKVAHDVKDFDRSFEIQQAGSKVIELSRSDWKVITEAA